MLNRNTKTLKVYSARISTSKQLYFANMLRISIKNTLNKQHTIINKQVKIYKSIETAKSNMQK